MLVLYTPYSKRHLISNHKSIANTVRKYYFQST